MTIQSKLLIDIPSDQSEEVQKQKQYITKEPNINWWQSIYVHFKTKEDRDSFARRIGYVLTGSKSTIWWPLVFRREKPQ